MLIDTFHDRVRDESGCVVVAMTGWLDAVGAGDMRGRRYTASAQAKGVQIDYTAVTDRQADHPRCS